MKTSKFLAIVLAFAMVLTTMSTVVFAGSNVVEAGTYDALVTAAAANAKTGNTIKLIGDITVPAGGKVTLDGVNLVATGTVTNNGTVEGNNRWPTGAGGFIGAGFYRMNKIIHKAVKSCTNIFTLYSILFTLKKF